MNIEWGIASLLDWQADALVFFAFEGPAPILPGLEQWMAEGGSWLTRLMASDDFQGKSQQISVFYGPEESKIPRVICVGLGPKNKFDMDKLRRAAAGAFRKCRDLRLSRPALPVSALEGLPVEKVDALEEVLIAGMSGLYRFQGFKTRDLDPCDDPQSLTLLSEEEPEESLQAAPAYVEAIVSGITLSRDLTSAPPNQATPSFLADTARDLAERYHFKHQVMDLEYARELGMGAFAAVAQGSREPARFIVLEHAPPGTEKESPLIFVGKGITFDTGGISLKPGKNMDAMKHDMAGAASVLGVFEILGRINPSQRIMGILPCTENMPDGKAYKPGDVIRTLSGLTVEVISTDAEGRLVLCDALTYAQRFSPALILDIATLTGACIVALGKHVAGVMGNRDTLVRYIEKIGMEVGEKVWPLPLWDLYNEYIKSDVADFKNVGERAAGSIVGGVFLKQFVPQHIPWVHLDIAGTAWADKDWGTAPKGATGFGVRIMAELIRRRASMSAD